MSAPLPGAPTAGAGAPAEAAAVARAGRGGGLAVLGALCSQGSLLLVVVLVARQGALDVGRYTTAVATLSLLVLVALGGFRAALTRFAAVHLADGDAARLRGLLLLGLGTSAAASTAAAAALLAGAPALAGAVGDPALTPLLRLVALALPGAVLAEALLAASQGWRTQRAHALVGRVLEPLLRLSLTGVALAAGAGTTGAVVALVASSWTAAVVAAVVLRRWTRRAAPPRDGGRPARVVEVRRVLSFSAVSWVASMAASGLVWADVLLLGALADQAAVGAYGVATRLAALVVLAGPPVVGAATPHLAHLLHVGDLAQAARVYASATRWTLVLALPAAVVVARHPAELLGVFGPAFPAAAAVTLVLLVGHLVGAAAGPCTALLTMAGRVHLSMAVNVAVLLGDVVLVLLLVPRLGAVGAALAWAAALVVGNVVKLLLARSVVGVRAPAEGAGRLLLATAAGALAAVVVGGAVSTWVGAVLLTAPVVLGVFAGTLVLLGLPPDDRELADAALARLRRGPGARRRPGGAAAGGAGADRRRSRPPAR